MRSLKSDLKFFDEHTKTLFENRDRILADPVLFGAYSPELWLKVAYTSGGGLLPLGILVELWMDDHWTHRCEKCQGTVLIHQLGGSPLNGAHVWRGVCVDCGQVIEEGSWSGSGKKFNDHSHGPVARARKKWKVSEDFGFEMAKRKNPSLKLMDVQGGMSIQTTDGPVDLQMRVEHSDGDDSVHSAESGVRATIPILEVLKHLRG